MIKLWRNRKKESAEITKVCNEEIGRRKFCIENAVFMDDVRSENLITVAERIYNYCWGEKA